MAPCTARRHIWRMIHRRLVRGAAFATLLLAAACDSGTDPEVQHPIDLVLDFCSNDVPVWIAYQNQGSDWVRLTPNAEGAVSFTANNRVGLAFVRQNGTDYDTEIIYAANTELEAVSGQTCREESGTKTVNGTVSGVVGSQVSQVGMSYSSVYLTSSQTSFSLTGLPDRPLDVVASRFNLTTTTQTADRVIIRRNQTLVNNATMPVLDFAAATTLVPTAFGVTVNGIVSGEFAFLQNYFVTQLETQQLLTHLEGIGNGDHTAVGVPNQDLAAGDYHDAFVVSVAQDGSLRGAERYFLAPFNQSLFLGGIMGIPSVTETAATPYLRLRAQVARAIDYARALRMEYLQQQQFSSTRVSVTVTSGYDAPSTWDATIPDLSGVSGWQNVWGLVNGGSAVDWDATVFGGRPELLFGARPVDNETVRFAARSSSVAASVADARHARATARLPRPFAPRR